MTESDYNFATDPFDYRQWHFLFFENSDYNYLFVLEEADNFGHNLDCSCVIVGDSQEVVVLTWKSLWDVWGKMVVQALHCTVVELFFDNLDFYILDSISNAYSY